MKKNKKSVFSSEDLNLIKRSLTYIKPFKVRFILSIILTLLGVFVSTIQPLILGKIIDEMVIKNSSLLYRYIFFILILSLSEGILRMITNYLIIFVANKIVLNLRVELFENILNFPISIFDSMKKGEFISRFESDINSLADILASRLTDLVVDIFKVVIIGAIVFKISYKMSLIIVTLFPVSYFLFYLFGKKIRKETIKYKKFSENYLSFLQEGIIGIREIKNLVIEKIMVNKMRVLQNDLISKNIHRNMINEYSNFINGIVSILSTIGVIVLGAMDINSGILTIGSFVAFINYASRFNSSLLNITKLNVKLQETLVSIKRIFDLIDFIDKDSLKNNQNTIIKDLKGCVKFTDVSFGYNNERLVLDNFNIEFERNSLTGIVGYSGIGKTTLFKLLLNYYNVCSGKITLDEVSILDLDISFIRKNIAYISQEPFFFNTSIKENLLYANEDASMEDIIEACKSSNIYDFILSLNKGYDTYIEEMSSNFSIGQKQRLAIARGILKKPKIYLFDEPTSALDGFSKKEIINLLKKLSMDSVVIIVSHDLEIIKNCDYIYLIDDGKAVDKGSYEDISKNSMIFEKLFSNYNRAI